MFYDHSIQLLTQTSKRTLFSSSPPPPIGSSSSPCENIWPRGIEFATSSEMRDCLEISPCHLPFPPHDSKSANVNLSSSRCAAAYVVDPESLMHVKDLCRTPGVLDLCNRIPVRDLLQPLTMPASDSS
jgi:hypothetical protein